MARRVGGSYCRNTWGSVLGRRAENTHGPSPVSISVPHDHSVQEKEDSVYQLLEKVICGEESVSKCV